jgi:hypothetical protein
VRTVSRYEGGQLPSGNASIILNRVGSVALCNMSSMQWERMDIGVQARRDAMRAHARTLDSSAHKQLPCR